jgi:hypothetical protein
LRDLIRHAIIRVRFTGGNPFVFWNTIAEWFARSRRRNALRASVRDRLGTLGLQMWEYKRFGESGEEAPSPECIEWPLYTIAAVG